MLVKIGFKIRQCLVQRLVADARIARWSIATAGFAHGAQCVARGIVLMFHHGHWVLHAAERRRQNGLLLNNGLLHPHDIGEQNLIFLHHVGCQLLD